MGAGANSSLLEGSDANNIVSELTLCNNLSYNLNFFYIRVSVVRKKIFIEDGIYKADNNISLYIAHNTITIILISNKDHQFRIWPKFIGINFIGKKYICYTTKDIKMQ